MYNLNHTLKACGPLALALVLTACGDKINSTQSLADSSSADPITTLAESSAEAPARSPDPVQSTVTEEFSTPGAESTASGGDPVVTLIARTNNDRNGSGTQLEWSAENVQECQTSGAWEGAVQTAGVVNINHEASGDHTYLISCRGSEGTAMAMVTVTVESTSLAWEAPASNTDGTELTDLAGYNLYYGTEPGQYSQVRSVRDPSQTELELPVEPGTYYLAMTAYDMTGNESELSNEITRVIY